HERVGLAYVLALNDPRLQRVPQPARAQYLARRGAVRRKVWVCDCEMAKIAGAKHGPGIVHVRWPRAPQRETTNRIQEPRPGDSDALLLEQPWPFLVGRKERRKRCAVFDLRIVRAGGARAHEHRVL